MIHTCDTCKKEFEGFTDYGYFMTEDGDVFCNEECAEDARGEQVETQWDSKGEAVEWNWFWTQDDELDEVQAQFDKLQKTFGKAFHIGNW